MTQEIIVFHESVRESWKKDFGTFVMVCGVFGVARLIDSSALEWVGGIIAAISIVGASVRFLKTGVTTPQKASNLLYRQYGVEPEKEAE